MRESFKIIINSTNEELEYPVTHIIVDQKLCIEYFDWLLRPEDIDPFSEFDLLPETIKYLKLVFTDLWQDEGGITMQNILDHVNTMATGLKHWIGRINLTLRLRNNYPLVHRYPESNIYPKYQANVANALYSLQIESQRRNK